MLGRRHVPCETVRFQRTFVHFSKRHIFKQVGFRPSSHSLVDSGSDPIRDLLVVNQNQLHMLQRQREKLPWIDLNAFFDVLGVVFVLGVGVGLMVVFWCLFQSSQNMSFVSDSHDFSPFQLSAICWKRMTIMSNLVADLWVTWESSFLTAQTLRI